MSDSRVHLFENNATSLLASELDAADTELDLASGYGDLFPSPGPGEIAVITIENLVQGTREIVFCTGRSGDTLTIERGQDGTLAQNFAVANTIVQQRVTKEVLDWLSGLSGVVTSFPVVVQLSCSNLTSDLEAGTNKGYFRAAQAFTITEIRASLLVHGDYNPVTVDLNKNGSTILSTKLTIDAGEKTSETAATPYVLTDNTVDSDDEFTIDIDGVGDGAKGLIFTIIGET